MHNHVVSSTVCIAMVNFRTPELVVESLRTISAQKQSLHGGFVVVVDNCSGDHSVEMIQNVIQKENWSSWVKFISSDKNGGFSYGSNVGIRHALRHSNPDYLMLLNPDTQVYPGAIDEMIGFLKSHPDVGVVGSRLVNSGDGVECSAHQFLTPISELISGARLGFLSRLLSRYDVTPPLRDEPHVCDWVSGSSMIVRKKVFDDVGLLDEGYFLYFEEMDFFKKVGKAGWQVWYVPSAVVMHIEGASTGINLVKRRSAYWFESRRRYLMKHHGLFGLLFADLLWVIGRASYVVRRVIRLGARQEVMDPPLLTLDIIWGDAKALLSGKAFRNMQEIQSK